MLIGKLSARRAILFLIPVSLMLLMWFNTHVSSYEKIKKDFKPSDIWIVDDQGNPLESIRMNEKKRSLDWVSLYDVSPAFKSLVIEVEDHRFYSHSGVDVWSLSKALLDKVLGRSSRGASTITMQLAGLIKEGKTNKRRTYSEKFFQILTALKVDAEWSKDEILEAYVNLVPFRGELIGLRAASLGYFRKNPSGLETQEAALLISLLPSPNTTPEKVAKRACRLLKNSDCSHLETLAFETFSSPYSLPRTREMVPVLSPNFIKTSENKSIIETTLDFRIQSLAMNALREQLRNLQHQNVNDGAVLILHTESGKVVAYIANGGEGSTSAAQIDGIQSRRQAGSTIKPFVYATAFDWQYIKPNSLLEDSPADISVGGNKVYHPKNYDHIFRGLVGVGEALGSSLNVPAVRTLSLVGEERVLSRLRAVGFKELQDDEFYGPSLALGTMDVTLWELTRGYRNFALDNSVFSNDTRAAIFNILASPEYRRFTFGLDGILTLPFPAAVKTGTSKDMRDNWCIGWTSEYTIGVWVGNFDGQPMWNVSGITGAAPIWRELMLALHPNPKKVATTYIAPAAPLLKRTISRIRYPAKGMLVGLDPDIPMRLQKLPIEIENPQPGHKIFLNEKLLNEAQGITLLPLKRGKYVVELKSELGKAVDEVKFEVR